jgi:hypothetical protein
MTGLPASWLSLAAFLALIVPMPLLIESDAFNSPESVLPNKEGVGDETLSHTFNTLKRVREARTVSEMPRK